MEIDFSDDDSLVEVEEGRKLRLENFFKLEFEKEDSDNFIKELEIY